MISLMAPKQSIWVKKGTFPNPANSFNWHMAMADIRGYGLIFFKSRSRQVIN
jgi:hypothetical protein